MLSDIASQQTRNRYHIDLFLVLFHEEKMAGMHGSRRFRPDVLIRVRTGLSLQRLLAALNRCHHCYLENSEAE